MGVYYGQVELMYAEPYCKCFLLSYTPFVTSGAGDRALLFPTEPH